MVKLRLFIVCCMLVGTIVPSRLHAQTPKVTAEQREANIRHHIGDFDYLLGDWEFTAESKRWGKFHGRWSAVRLNHGEVLDEYRILGNNDDTTYVTTTIRAYNAVLDQWELIGMDRGGGLRDVGTAHSVGQEMQLEQTFGAMSDTPTKMRVRYFNIAPDHFSWVGDRSVDGGKTWIKDFQRIEARRVGPLRTLDPLAKSSQ